MILFIAAAVLTIVLDQITKLLAVHFLSGGGEIEAIPRVIRLVYVENRGAAFGMLSDHRWIFMVISCAALALIAAYAIKKRPASVMERLALALLLGGGIGNMIDRIRLGYVVDFIDFEFVKFYVFNTADAAVCVGCGLLILHLLISDFFSGKRAGTDNGNK